MPDIKVKCCGFDKPVSRQECLDHAAGRGNSCPFTYELLSSMYATMQDRGDRISTTALTAKCFRSTYLERTEDHVIEPQSRYAAWRGTMYHNQLEHHAAPGAVFEARYHVDLEGLGPLSGSPDLIDVGVGILYDYKTSKENPRFYPWKDHVEQLQFNRWLVDHAHKVEFLGRTHDLSSTTQRAKFVPVDWQELVVVYLDPKGAAPMTVTRSEEVEAKTTGRTKKVRVPDIWDDDTVEALIRERYEARKAAFEHAEVPPIPEGFEAQAHPLCGFCDVRDKCREYELEELVERRLNHQQAA